MKTRLPVSILLAFAAFAITPFSHGQLVTMTNIDSYAGFQGSLAQFATSGSLASRYQTFSNVSAVTSMTLNFFTSSTTTGSTFSATFGQWNGSAFVGPTSTFANFVVPGSNAWPNQTIDQFSGPTFQKTLDLTSLVGANATYGYLTDYTKTYAMVLTNIGGGTGISLGVNETNPFSFGQASNGSSNDYVFAQMVVYEGNQPLVATPEASTVASIVGAALVAGLVFLRMRQRRLAPVPVAVA
jgi:hypothetical protein